MESEPTWQPVVALALWDQSGRLLMQQRPLHKRHGGLWELPGGKVESVENPRLALVREISEELSIELRISALQPWHFADEGAAGRIVLFVYSCDEWMKEIAANEGQEWGWFTLEEARKLPMPPMDGDLLTRIWR